MLMKLLGVYAGTARSLAVGVLHRKLSEKARFAKRNLLYTPVGISNLDVLM